MPRGISVVPLDKAVESCCAVESQTAGKNSMMTTKVSVHRHSRAGTDRPAGDSSTGAANVCVLTYHIFDLLLSASPSGHLSDSWTGR